jgi:hypothetical protein
LVQLLALIGTRRNRASRRGARQKGRFIAVGIATSAELAFETLFDRLEHDATVNGPGGGAVFRVTLSLADAKTV